MTFGQDLETVIMSTGSDSVAAPLDAEREDPNSSTAADSPLNDADLRTPKRRKAAQRRVICVPADERQRGDGPPSDSWTWRKYGQKPIKGSPYPRGYYRCSSSKGCSARKQVERSRDDPSMLVITYTSDHSHGLPFNLTDTVSEKIGGTRDVEPCNSPSKIEEEDEDFFADLGELPQSSSAINSRGSFFEEDETSSSCIAGHWYAMSSCI